MTSKCEHELLCTEIADRKYGEFRYHRIQFPHAESISPGDWYSLMHMITSVIQEGMVSAGVPVYKLRWQFAIPLTVIDADGEYIHNPCPLLS